MNSRLLNLASKKRDVILNAALKEFALKGFDEASTNVIAKESGLSKGLMFHYINSKKELYLFLYDYCAEILKKEFYDFVNFSEKNILDRLRQVYLLQIEILHRYPWLLEFINIAATVTPDEVKGELSEKEMQSVCYETMFEGIDESVFREGLDIEKCKQLIYWANIGFTNQILDEIKNSEIDKLDYDKIVSELDSYLDELRKCFYKSK